MKYLSSSLVLIFALSLFSTKSLAENEPNNDIANANVIGLNIITNGSLSSSDLIDFYKITTTVDGRLSIDDNTSSNLGYNMSFYDADGSTLIKTVTRYESNSGTRISVNLSPGNYYIKFSRTGYGSGSYTINPLFNSISHTGDNESNDEFTSANILKLNTQNKGNLGSRRDGIWDKTDYWKINIIEDGRLIIKDTTESHLGYNISLYDNDGTTLIKSETRYTSNSGTRLGVNLSPGIYYLKLQRTGYDYTNYGTYTMFPDFTPVTHSGDAESNDIYTNADAIILNIQNSGNLGSRRDGIWDKTDYWKITIPEDGRLIIKDTTESHLGYNISLYDDDGTTLIKNHTRYESNSGTRLGVNLSPGIYYLKLTRTGYDYSSYGTYTIFPDFEPVTYPGDTESNDVYTNSDTIILNIQNSGNLGSRRDGIWDKTDYWKINILEDGRLILKDTTESHLGYNISLYDDDGTTLIKNHTRYESNSGTRLGVNLSPGIYYLKLARTGYDYSSYGTYTIFPDFEPVTYSGDSEPNDSLEIAVNLVLNAQNTGNLGSRRDSIWDKTDYWKITIPEDGSLIIKDTTESHLGYNISLYESDGSTLIKKHTRYVSNSGSRITVNISPGIYYLKLARTGYDYSTYGSYTIFPDYKKNPKADFEVYQDIKTISFNNKTIDGESYIWDFDDGTTSELENPSHSYSNPGEYLVSLIATNLAGEDTAKKNVVIYGIKGVSPQIIGNNGVVTITVLGGGFSAQSIVKIIRGGNMITAASVKYIERGAIEATFNLNSVEIGSCNVSVTNVGKPEIIEENALNIVQANEPEPWVNISGRTKALFNRWQTYTLEYGNTGNVDADYVPVYITMSDPDNNTLEFIDLNIVYPDFVAQNDLTARFDSIDYYFDVDTIFGEVKKTRVYPLVVPKIPAGYTGSIQFKIKTGTSVTINAWNNAPMIIDNKIAKNCDGEDPELTKCIHLAMVKAASTGVVGIVNEMIPGYACVVAVGSEVFTIANNNIGVGEGRTWGSALYSWVSVGLGCVGDVVKTIAVPLKVAIGVVSVIQLTDQAFTDVDNCKTKFAKKSFRNKDIRGVTSFDPNEIVGPSGFGDNQYITSLDKANYTIFFENKSNATAPAQEIWIVDTLDVTKFKTDNFSFDKITIGTSTINLLTGQKEFSKDIDLRPKQNIIGRITGTFDSDKGIIKVYFTSLNPDTMSDNEDPELGILPPNKNLPEGEGSISFSVGIQSLADGFTFKNKATIIFDYNEPIITNIWENTIDKKAPSSEINYHSYNKDKAEITITIDGADTNSGVWYYSLYSSVDGSDFEPLLLTYSNEITIKVEKGSIYKFYSVATDMVGNEELAPDVEDLNFEALGISDHDKFSIYNIYPNPVQGILYIDSQMNGDSFIEIIDTKGRTVATKLMKTISGKINLTSLSKGVYYIRITNDEYSVSKKIIVE